MKIGNRESASEESFDTEDGSSTREDEMDGRTLAALLTQIGALKSRGFKVVQVISDGEGGIIKAFEGSSPFDCPLTPRGTKMHAPWVERKIRTVKEICRAVFTTLPFRFPNSFIKFLASFAASRVNILPNKSGLAGCPKSFFLRLQTGISEGNARHVR